MASLGLFTLLPANDAAKTSRKWCPGRTTAVLMRSLAAASGSRLEKLVKPCPSNHGEKFGRMSRSFRNGWRGAVIASHSYINISHSSKVLVPYGVMPGLPRTTVLSHSACMQLAAGLGYLAPDFWLNNRISARKMKLSLGLPKHWTFGDLRGGGPERRQGDHAHGGGAADQPAGHRR